MSHMKDRRKTVSAQRRLFKSRTAQFFLASFFSARLFSARFLLLVAFCLSPSSLHALSHTAAGFEAAVKSAGDAARRGEELRRKWDLAGAEAAFREAAALDPLSLEATMGLARIARARLRYAESVRMLDKAAAHHRGSADLLAEYGQIYLAVEEAPRARRFFENALKINPDHVAAIVGLAGVDLLQRDYKSAEARLRDLLARNSQVARVHTMLGRVMLENNNNREAADCAARAIAIDAYDTEALSILAFVKATERKADEVRSLARRAIALDPLNAGARRLLSQYLNSERGYEQKMADAARLQYERGKARKQEGKLAEAVVYFEAALAVAPRYYRALIALADIWLMEGDYERAATAAKLAIEVDPEGVLAHLELSYATWGMQERARIEIGAVDFAAMFYAREAPPAFDLTAELFPNYKSLARRQQVVIDQAVAPLAEFLPRLVRSGARHYLLAFDQRVSEIGELDDVAGEKTFDGRYYASIRGVGGRITVSGIEYVELAARGGFHTIAHEFAHQVHMTALGKEDVRIIRRLYEQARREGRALDYYAASNEFEYFAQGYEAFISETKRPAAGVTARHTNRELLMRDPELHKFFVRITGQSRARASVAAAGERLCLTSNIAACDD